MPALGRPDLVEHGLEALLELAPVLGAGDQRAHVQGKDRLVAQAFGYVAPDDALGQPLHDGGLAHAGVTDEHGVVLGLTGEDLDDAADLGVPADHGVELARPGAVHQVEAVLAQGLVGPFGRGRGDPLVAPDGAERSQEPVTGHAPGLKQAAGGAGGTFVDQGQH